VKQPKLTLIFKGQGLRISPTEKAEWDPRVNVTFQKEAWADNKWCELFATIEAPKILEGLYGTFE